MLPSSWTSRLTAAFVLNGWLVTIFSLAHDLPQYDDRSAAVLEYIALPVPSYAAYRLWSDGRLRSSERCLQVLARDCHNPLYPE